ncbi:MAG: PhoX family protein [Actinomycetota bacterium]|nr:PhoX family protein [Actinomycetota bacterium]MDH4352453.1 PhoX family protein [Actinomycetota bacterium]MDH5277936.1 PhoX family protein [Actinomycetota bacterium]
MTDIDRRTALTLGAAGALTFSLGFWKSALAEPAVVGPGPYGPLGPPDRFGVRLPVGFGARLVGRTGERVPNTNFRWVGEPDGAATFPVAGGGWIYAANSELNGTAGGAAAIQFDARGDVVDAYRILGGTKWNCAGGATPWGTWLSGEEHRQGHVWECDPTQPGQGVERPQLGTFAHEASVVDPATGWVYLTEDDGNGRFYRFRPTRSGDLSRGHLEAAHLDTTNSRLTWVPVSAARPERSAATTAFNRGEGAWFSDGYVYFTTTGDDRVWAYHPGSRHIEVIYDAAALGDAAPLRDPDNITVHGTSGDIFVGEDADDLQLVLLADGQGRRVAAPFLQLVGHGGSESGAPGQDGDAVPSASWKKTSEITGLAFSPDGTRLYCTSQRGTDGVHGMTFEISGPFRR